MANFTALAAARHALLARAGWDVEADGLFGAPPITVVVGDEAHPTLLKALGLLGLRAQARRARAGRRAGPHARRRAAARSTGPTIVCSQAGNVNTGAFDPVGEIARARTAPARGCTSTARSGCGRPPRRRAPTWSSGIAHADSWATDAHKWLNVPYDSGLAFVRDAAALRAAMAITAAYLPAERPARTRRDYTPELSRRARGVEVWAALRSLGRAGLAELVERTCRHAARFAEGLATAGYEVLNDVVLNQVLVSFGDAETTQPRRSPRCRRDGTCWCGGTVWQGRTAMRISVSSWATTDEDVERSLAAMLRVAAASNAPLERGGGAQHGVVVPGQADDLQAQRQAVAVAGRQWTARASLGR